MVPQDDLENWSLTQYTCLFTINGGNFLNVAFFILLVIFDSVSSMSSYLKVSIINIHLENAGKTF